MSIAPKSPNENRRLRMLETLGILDTLPEAFSESVATAAASIANMPIAAISLVDEDRQWFKGSCGLNVRETSRDVSFCAHAILESTPLVINDTHADERFRDNPLVTGEPFIRFYAGFPLMVNGQPVGALCIIDDRCRELSPAQTKRLIALAEGTAAWLTDYRGRKSG